MLSLKDVKQIRITILLSLKMPKNNYPNTYNLAKTDRTPYARKVQTQATQKDQANRRKEDGAAQERKAGHLLRRVGWCFIYLGIRNPNRSTQIPEKEERCQRMNMEYFSITNTPPSLMSIPSSPSTTPTATLWVYSAESVCLPMALMSP